MYAVLCFDTEDVFTPPEYGTDDVPKWLADILTEHGLRGSFFVFAEKARMLKRRGRSDVIKSLLQHDVASHQQGNVRPVIPEICAHKGWRDGVAAMREYEDVVKADFLDAFGREPVALSQHNSYFAPQHVAVAGERGLPYMYGLASIPDYQQPTWYAGALTFGAGYDSEYFEWGDWLYSSDAPFEKELRRLAAFIDDHVKRGSEFVTIFAGHPVQVIGRGWVEHYLFPSGMSKTPQELGWVYAVKTPQEAERARANFARLAAYLRDHPALKVVGVAEAGELFRSQPAEITRDELTSYAEQVADEARPVSHSTFSPAEMMCGLAESLVEAETRGDVPYTVRRREVLGPTSRPAVGREVDIVPYQQVLAASREVLQGVESDGFLTANVVTEAGRLGAGQLLVLFSRCYLAAARYERYERLRVPEAPRYPQAAALASQMLHDQLDEHWGFPLDFSCEQLAEHTRLQTWAMKPAWLRPPRASSYGEGRIRVC